MEKWLCCKSYNILLNLNKHYEFQDQVYFLNFYFLLYRNLSGRHLEGALAPELGNLTHLRFLWVSNLFLRNSYQICLIYGSEIFLHLWRTLLLHLITLVNIFLLYHKWPIQQPSFRKDTSTARTTYNAGSVGFAGQLFEWNSSFRTRKTAFSKTLVSIHICII